MGNTYILGTARARRLCQKTEKVQLEREKAKTQSGGSELPGSRKEVIGGVQCSPQSRTSPSQCQQVPRKRAQMPWQEEALQPHLTGGCPALHPIPSGATGAPGTDTLTPVRQPCGTAFNLDRDRRGKTRGFRGHTEDIKTGPSRRSPSTSYSSSQK